MAHSGIAAFQLVLGLLLGGVGLALLAPRLGAPWPALVALAGAALAFVPGVPEVSLDPDLALALFVAPVLLDAAYDASPRDLRRNWVSVGSLVIGAVGITVLAVAWVAHVLEPSLPWAAAVTLGAIVAPPDAAAATAVLRQVRLPHRLTVILEGESLLNDASALLIYRFTVGMVAAGVTAWTVPLLALAAVGGVVLGVLLARAYVAVIVRVEDGAPSVVLQFLGTFGVWLLAEALDLSAVLTMVAYAVTLAQMAPGRIGARARRNAYAVWDVAVFVLNVLAFILIGLQLRGILARMDGQEGRYALVAASVLATAIAARLLWVVGHHLVVRWRPRRTGGEVCRSGKRPKAREALLVGWCGMRGIVTLAAALALPAAFPFRDLIVFAAFCVVLGTLVLQGLTLRPLLARLALPADDAVEREVAMARVESARAALDALASPEVAVWDGEARAFLERTYRGRIEAGAEPGRNARDPVGLDALRRIALLAERRRLAVLREDERIGDDAFHVLEEELDWAEADLQ